MVLRFCVVTSISGPSGQEMLAFWQAFQKLQTQKLRTDGQTERRFMYIDGGVMGHVNLSIYVGRTSKKVSGQKNFYGPVQGPSKLKSKKNSRTSKSGIIYFAHQIWH